MTRRVVAITLLLILVLLGLTAGVFMETIQRSLTLPDMQDMFRGNVGKTPTTMPTIAPTAKPKTTPTIAVNALARDSFQRQDQSLWGTASDGNTWMGDANARANFSINGQEGTIANGTGALNALLGPAKGNIDLLIHGSLNRFSGNNNLGSVLRWQNINNWYKAYINGTSLIIIRQINGVQRQLVSVPFAARGGISYALRFRVFGGTLLARAWEANTAEPANWLATANDASLQQGQAGVRVLMDAGSIIKITTFEATAATGVA
ncbi:hypothetical protein [Ktedonospora formicarum]|uniref:Uncharacterized protein n=1 Tax=Ktedonospora formicarum TaxID=2778364 RepID=A0A8J3MUA4_9CHLR|nr:hypothetical protein [Ktedonospora formicarum]GHO46423.1 hypothetical protein KSX_45860 [Ktedonospora formicarum]